MAQASETYDADILAWSEHQAELLRQRAAGELVNEAEPDWTNIVEEIESVGCSEWLSVGSLLIKPSVIPPARNPDTLH